MGYNDITGDKLVSKTLSPEGKANWDTIFPPKVKEDKKQQVDTCCCHDVCDTQCNTSKD